MNLQKGLVSQEIVFDERLKSGAHKNAEWRKSSGSPIPSTATCATDADRKDFSDENESQVEERKKLEHSSAPGADRMNLRGICAIPHGGDIQHDRVKRFHLAGVINAANNQPVVWAPPPPPDPPNPS